MSCHDSDVDARFHEHRTREVQTLLGTIPVRRAYYTSPAGNEFPRDLQLRIDTNGHTPAYREVVALCGIQESFGQASKRMLRRLTSLHPSKGVVRSITEQAGERAAEHQANGRRASFQSWEWLEDKRGKTVGFLEIDATGIRMQAPGGGPAEGRMPWLGMVFSGSESGKRYEECRYVSLLGPLEEFEGVLARQLAPAIDLVDEWVCLSDAGNGIEAALARLVPFSTCILDFYHVSEYLAEIARGLHPDDSSREAWLEDWCHQLKHEGGQSVLDRLRSERETLSLAGEPYETTLGYFENHVSRMDYPRYRLHGWPIGSGAIESGCKRVIDGRLCGAGMRWGDAGAEAMCPLRALFLSEPKLWARFWSEDMGPQRPPRAAPPATSSTAA